MKKKRRRRKGNKEYIPVLPPLPMA